MVSQQFACCIWLPKDRSVKKLSTKARVPTEGPERQEVSAKASVPTEEQERQEVSAKAKSAKLERTTNDRHDGNHTRIGHSYPMAVPMNISSHREVGDPTIKIYKATKRRANETPYQNKKMMQEANHKTTCDEEITTPNA